MRLQFTMATAATKRKLNIKSIKERYAALKELEEGLSKSQAPMESGIPKNTLST